jgi:hypothetical protein
MTNNKTDTPMTAEGTVVVSRGLTSYRIMNHLNRCYPVKLPFAFTKSAPLEFSECPPMAPPCTMKLKKTTSIYLSLVFYRREQEMSVLKDRLKKADANDPNMESLKKSLSELENKKKDAEGKAKEVDKDDKVSAVGRSYISFVLGWGLGHIPEAILLTFSYPTNNVDYLVSIEQIIYSKNFKSNQ